MHGRKNNIYSLAKQFFYRVSHDGHVITHLRSGDDDPDNLVIFGSCSFHALVQLLGKEGGNTTDRLDCRGRGGGG